MFIVKVFAHGQAFFVDVSPLACALFLINMLSIKTTVHITIYTQNIYSIFYFIDIEYFNILI